MVPKPLGPQRSNPRVLRGPNQSDTYREAMAYEQRTTSGTLKPGFRGTPAEALRQLSVAAAPLKPIKVTTAGIKVRGAARTNPKSALLSQRSPTRPKHVRKQGAPSQGTHRDPREERERDDTATPEPEWSEHSDSDQSSVAHKAPDDISSSSPRGVSSPVRAPSSSPHAESSPVRVSRSVPQSGSQNRVYEQEQPQEPDSDDDLEQTGEVSGPRSSGSGDESHTEHAPSDHDPSPSPSPSPPPTPVSKLSHLSLVALASFPDGLTCQVQKRPPPAKEAAKGWDGDQATAPFSDGSDYDMQGEPACSDGSLSPSPSPAPSQKRRAGAKSKPKSKSSTQAEKAAKAKQLARAAAALKKQRKVKAAKSRLAAKAKAKIATPINPNTKTKSTAVVASPLQEGDGELRSSPLKKKKKSRKSQVGALAFPSARLDDEAKYEGTSFPAIFDEGIPLEVGRRRSKSSKSSQKYGPRPHIRHEGGRGSGKQGQFVFADMDTVERGTYTSMCIEVRIRLVKEGKPWASAGDLVAVVNDLLAQARFQLHVEISWHAGFQAQLYQNAKSWISKCGREIKFRVMKKYGLSYEFTNKGKGEVDFTKDSRKAAAAALRSCENLRADGQADVDEDENLLLGSLLHESAVCLLGSMISLPPLVLVRGAERDHCVLLGFGLLGISYAGILRTLEHAKEGSGSCEFSDDYQLEANNVALTGQTLTDALQDIVLIKLWRLAGAHAAGLGKLAKVAVSAQAAKKALFRNRA
ncbi:hypothetical protein P7C70_g4749, partial [Phenoliferia sp. Uapishka_3]